jgi:signal transduction histidine kinase
MISRLARLPGGLRAQVFAIALAIALFGAAISLVSALAERRELEADAEREVLRLARLLAGREEQQIDAVTRLLTALALIPEIRDPNSARCEAVLAQVLADTPGLANIEVASADGRVVCRARPDSTDANVSERPWFREAMMTGRVTLGGVALGAPPNLPLAVPLRDERGAVVGALIARLDVTTIGRLTAGLELPPATALLVLDDAGRVVYRDPDAERFVGQEIAGSELGRSLETQSDGVFLAAGLDGVRRLYAVVPLRPAGALLLGVPADVVYQPAADAFRRDVLVITLALVGLLLVVWVAIGAVVGQPLQRLTTVARRLAAGDYSARTGIGPTRSEIGELARTFDMLAAELERRDRRIQAQVAELRRSNAELDQFASVVSHDLQAPLRSIAGFSQLLARRYRGRLDAEADEFIQYIVTAVDRLNALIVDLLTYSRVATGPRTIETIASRQAVDQALSNLRSEIDASNASIHLGELPVVRADLSQLTQVFQNLVSNAIKYRGAAAPVITIDAEREPEAWIFRVRDNGIGIPPEHAERVFRMFQRLHSASAYEGTGIGLAVCKAVIERHGGQIWIEPGPAGGTVVAFRLPIERTEE